MNVVYIAGPFRAKSAWEIECNIRRAEEAALGAWRAGFAVLCPHTNTRFFQGAADDKIWLEGDLELLRRCDAVLTIPGWENSHGAQSELDLARDCAMPVFHKLEDLIKHYDTSST